MGARPSAVGSALRHVRVAAAKGGYKGPLAAKASPVFRVVVHADPRKPKPRLTVDPATGRKVDVNDFQKLKDARGNNHPAKYTTTVGALGLKTDPTGLKRCKGTAKWTEASGARLAKAGAKPPQPKWTPAMRQSEEKANGPPPVKIPPGPPGYPTTGLKRSAVTYVSRCAAWQKLDVAAQHATV